MADAHELTAHLSLGKHSAEYFLRGLSSKAMLGPAVDEKGEQVMWETWLQAEDWQGLCGAMLDELGK